MLTGDLRNKVDQVWNAFWSGGIANPIEVIEQITYLLFCAPSTATRPAKTTKPCASKPSPCASSPQAWTRKSARTTTCAGPASRTWPRPRCSTCSATRSSPSCAGCKPRAARRLKAPLPATWRVPASPSPRPPAGQGGGLARHHSAGRPRHQGRPVRIHARQDRLCRAKRAVPHPAPHHRFDGGPHRPHPQDTICDPASGTCGFFVAAGEYLRRTYPDMLRVPAQNAHFHSGMFHGYDFDNTMLRIGSMNMVLHGVEHPAIEYRDSLAEGARVTPRPTASSWPTRPLRAAWTTKTPPRICSKPSKPKRPSCCFWHCSCAS